MVGVDGDVLLGSDGRGVPEDCRPGSIERSNKGILACGACDPSIDGGR
jgi:hypothetical protein